MLKTLREIYALPRSEFEEPGDFPDQAAVLLALTDHASDPEIILTKRAEHLNAHSGEVSFPGGKWEEEDDSLIVTALREAQEEIDLSPQDVDVLNVGQWTLSRAGMRVTPYIGVVPQSVSLRPNPEEIDSIFRVPLSFFLNDNRTRTDIYSLAGGEYWSPVYHYDGYEIWGLTARILIQFLNHAFDAEISRESDAPEHRRVRGR